VSTFDFITDQEFRRTLEADHAEMLACIEVEAWKAAHVLAGSIVEALLVEYLLRQNDPDPLKMSLAELIETCRAAKVLSARTADLSSVIRSYRNLIHPGRSLRLGDRPDHDGAIVARTLVSIIVREVAATQEQRYGLTAEQMVSKIRRDATALGIVEHLLRDTPAKELERLLLHVLPARYFDEAEAEPTDHQVLETYARLFRTAFECAPDRLKRRVLSRYVRVLKEEPAPRVQVYEEQFFRAADLRYVAAKDRGLVKAHLLSRIDEAPTLGLMRAAQDLGRWVVEGDITTYVDMFLRLATWRHADDLGEAARHRFEEEASRTPPAIQPLIAERVDAWVEMFGERGDPARGGIASAVKAVYEGSGDVPG
jgi:hypothetical protein